MARGLYKQHTFYYTTPEDYVRQLDMEMQRALGNIPMEPYAQVRARYNLGVTAFCMRLARFIHAGGNFPHTRGAQGRKIIEMVVTPALNRWLLKRNGEKSGRPV